MREYDTEELCGVDTGRGYNMNTASGKPLWPVDPRPEDIRIEDLARHLSRVCRFNGAIKAGALVMRDYGPAYIPRLYETYVNFEVYSVAQHSVFVCDRVEDPSLKLAALLHDAHEYVLGDMIKPQKNLYQERGLLEAKWDVAIAKRFGFAEQLFLDPAIKEADYRTLLTEKRDVLETTGETDFGVAGADPYPQRIVPLLPSRAYALFMHRLRELYKGD